MYIDNIISELVKKYKTNDPFQIAKEKGIVILYQDLGNTYGYYRSYKRMPIIHINNSLDEKDQKFTCCHELAHATLHPYINTTFLKKNTFFSVDKIEVEANYFATHLLLYNQDFENCETKIDILRENGIPYEMERFL
ncbi:ImmA/IrrE family metallo-endopeptidase [Rummeliibacillus sp. POC4]|uniref:ImmA/IrrE family metallo-endopeptidase n=1 Tax=Rummeliibacillus sp. POC4 TaxID=2305899 RepID=UPI000E670033|nr:ImmA/IrrE family metallo-endopeptidase [Rummeliibacillus sp. POC4]RIJ64122.1 ImmA/IrrE family metallo-endopeptidase [Rummeliibacillus sp. POC4]